MRLIREIIQLPPDYSITETSGKMAHSLATSAQQITEVTCPDQQTLAVNCGRDLRKHVNEVEKMRKELTEPLLKAQRQLKALADAHCGPLKAELDRIEGLVALFQKQEADRVAMEAQQRHQEIMRLEREKQEAMRAAQTEDITQSIQSEQRAYDAEQAQATIVMTAPAVAAKANGTQVRKIMRWECTDIAKLFAARPELCNPPTPKASAIQACCVPEMPVVGLKLWWEDKVSIRQ